MLAYSLTTVYLVIVIVALAEELLGLLMLVVIPLSRMQISAIEMLVSLSPRRTNPADRIAGIISRNGFLASTLS